MTGLGGGQRVAKDSQRVETYGTVDELNSQIGVALATGLCERLTTELTLIQNELFDLGSDLATPATSQARHPVPTVEARHIEKLERLIDELNEVVGPLTNFLLPGGSPGAAQLHVARTICRRAEREATTPGARRDDRPDACSPTSTACPTRSSSWRATRTTNAASPNRSGGRASDVDLSRVKDWFVGRPSRTIEAHAETVRRDTTVARPAAAPPHDRRAGLGGRRQGRQGTGTTRNPTPRRRSSAAADRRRAHAPPSTTVTRRSTLAEQVGIAADEPRVSGAPSTVRVVAIGRQRHGQPESSRCGRRPRRRSIP